MEFIHHSPDMTYTELPNRVFDCDQHLYESADAFTRYLPERYKSDFYFVEKNGRDKVVIDGNHPLAGMALRFDIAVLEVRKATEDEVARELLMIEEMDDFDATRDQPSGSTLH